MEGFGMGLIVAVVFIGSLWVAWFASRDIHVAELRTQCEQQGSILLKSNGNTALFYCSREAKK